MPCPTFPLQQRFIVTRRSPLCINSFSRFAVLNGGGGDKKNEGGKKKKQSRRDGRDSGKNGSVTVIRDYTGDPARYNRV